MRCLASIVAAALFVGWASPVMADDEAALAEHGIYVVTVYEYQNGWKVRDTGLWHFFYDYPHATLTCGYYGHHPAVYPGAYYDAKRVGPNFYEFDAWYPYGHTPVPPYDEFEGYYNSETGTIIGFADDVFLFYGKGQPFSVF